MSYGLFYLPSSLPAARGEGAMRFRTVDRSGRVWRSRLVSNSVWLAEHHFHPFAGIFSAPPVIGAAIAERTRRMRIGTAVLLLPYHHPLRVAENYATLDCLSGGRVEFGVGHGFVKWEALTFGIPLDELRDRFKENLAIVLKAWREPKLDHQGHFYNFHGVEVLPRPVQEPHPTVWMAATTPVESFELSGVGISHDADPVSKRGRRAARDNAGVLRCSAGWRDMIRRRRECSASITRTSVKIPPRRARRQNSDSPSIIRRRGLAHSLTPGMADPESYRSHDKHRAAMKRLTFDELIEQHRVFVGSAEEVRDHVAYVRERLYLTDLAGNFALGGLNGLTSSCLDAAFHGTGSAESSMNGSREPVADVSPVAHGSARDVARPHTDISPEYAWIPPAREWRNGSILQLAS